MIKLNASYALKVPASEQYSSQSYHASAEIEVADSAVQNGLKEALSQLWSELRSAVEKEIYPRSKSNGQPQNRLTTSPDNQATKKQIGYLFSCARRFKNFSAEQTKEWVQSEFDISLDDLSKSQAGQIIDHLQGK